MQGAGDERIVDQEAFGECSQMRIAELEQKAAQAIEEFRDVLLDAWHEFFARDLGRIDALEGGENDLQRPLEELHFALDAQKVGFVEGAELRLVGVPEASA